MFGYQSNLKPDWRNVQIAAAENRLPPRIPIYEHMINPTFIDLLAPEPVSVLQRSKDPADVKRYFEIYCAFWRAMGYDTVSFECCVAAIFPGGGALGSHVEGVIKTRADLDKYPWEELPDRYFDAFAPQFEAFLEALPDDMRAIGGVGNGLFECVQDLTGYMNLCYIREDDPELYRLLFERVGQVMLKIWQRFLPRYSQRYVVCRMGDDMGFRTQTLLAPEDFRAHLVPGLKRIIDAVHAAGKPFLLHSCGNIFDIMPDLIGAGINAKHSNEDQIAPFSKWLDDFGSQIALFGGIDLNILCLESEQTIRDAVREKFALAKAHGTGFALGSGNSIPDYVPVDGYLTMVDEANKQRSGG